MATKIPEQTSRPKITSGSKLSTSRTVPADKKRKAKHQGTTHSETTEDPTAKVSGVEPSTYMLTWNPDSYPFSDLEQKIEQINRDGFAEFSWSTGTRTTVTAGDAVYLLRQGKESPGILGHGTIQSAVDQNISIGEKADSSARNSVPVRWDFLSLTPVLTREFLIEQFGSPAEQMCNARASGQVIAPDNLRIAIDDAWKIAISSSVHKLVVPVGDRVSKKDLLGRIRLVRVLKGIIKHTSGAEGFRPFVIGLFGKWGSGKSTVIQLLVLEFENDKKFKMIEFNAWQNEHCQNMGAALAEKIISELYIDRSPGYRWYLTLKYQVFVQKDIVSILFALSTLIFGFLTAATYFGLTDLTVPLPNNLGGSNSGIMAFLSASVVTLRSFVNHPFTKRLRDLNRRPSFSDHLGIAQKIKTDVAMLFKASSWNLLDTLRNRLFSPEVPDTKYTIVVDDLDRCAENKILQMLEAVRLVMDLPNVVVILAVDKDILLRAVANRYKNQDNAMSLEDALLVARDYLGKILQLSVELDDPEFLKIQEFVAKRLYPGMIDEVAAGNAIESGKGKEDVEGSETHNHSESDIDPSFAEEYIVPTVSEAEYFTKCIGVFGITNPRTLVRLHNVLLLMKGMYPEILGTDLRLRQNIFFVFLNELLCSKNIEQSGGVYDADVLERCFGDEAPAIDKMSVELDVEHSNEIYLLDDLNHIKKLSLPSASARSTEVVGQEGSY